MVRLREFRWHLVSGSRVKFGGGEILCAGCEPLILPRHNFTVHEAPGIAGIITGEGERQADDDEKDEKRQFCCCWWMLGRSF